MNLQLRSQKPVASSDKPVAEGTRISVKKKLVENNDKSLICYGTRGNHEKNYIGFFPANIFRAG